MQITSEKSALELETLKDLGQRFLMRKERLAKLVSLNAPEQVIEQEKRLIASVTSELLSRDGSDAEEIRAKLGIVRN
jgi:DNA-directed RNA polymerase beta' subunit